jgi:hypothetical protein
LGEALEETETIRTLTFSEIQMSSGRVDAPLDFDSAKREFTASFCFSVFPRMKNIIKLAVVGASGGYRATPPATPQVFIGF